METPTIIIFIVLLVFFVIILYYCLYVKNNEEIQKDIPHTLINRDDNTIINLLKNISEKYGSYPALKKKIDGKWKTITYSEYYNSADAFSQRLLYFIGPHPRVSILSFNRPEWFYIHIGTMIANGISIGMYPTSTSESCSFIVNHSVVDVLVVEDIKQMSKFYNIKISSTKIILTLDYIDNDDEITKELIDNIKENNPQIQIISYDAFINSSLGNTSTSTTIETRTPFPEDTATIIYTSGTTGDPKGVVISHKNIISSIRSALYTLKSKSNISIYTQERFISYLPLNHVAAQMMDIYIPISSVGIVHFADKDALQGSLKNDIKEIKPTVFIGVPRVWEKIMEKIMEKEDPYTLLNQLIRNKFILKEIGLDKAKYCITSAAPIADKTRDFYKSLGAATLTDWLINRISGQSLKRLADTFTLYQET